MTKTYRASIMVNKKEGKQTLVVDLLLADKEITWNKNGYSADANYIINRYVNKNREQILKQLST